MSQSKVVWLNKKLNKAYQLLGKKNRISTKSSDLKLGIDLGTSNIVSMLLSPDNEPLATIMTPADVVRDGIVWDFFGAVQIVASHLEELRILVPELPHGAITSFPPGTEARISSNVLDAAGIDVKAVIDEPSAVAHLLKLDNAAIVDIGGGTTGVAVIKNQKVIYSGDEPTGGHHISLTLSGNQSISLEDAEVMKKVEATKSWTIVRPVFEKMTDIVRTLLRGHTDIQEIYLSGGSCMMPGVLKLFQQEFPEYRVILPENAILLTPYAITAYEG